jgi:hypothetical protein
MFLAGRLFWPCSLPFWALLFALAVLGVRDILFAIDLRSWTRAIRGVALLLAPLAVSLVCLLSSALAVLQLLQDMSVSP